HRDLKPSNILLTADGTPKVSDFSLAKRLDRDDGVTLGTGALGTPSYMPPEQISSKNGELGPWSDVYGLGATLYHLLTGRAPFVGETSEEIIPQVLLDPPMRPRALRPEIPLALEGIIIKCLEKDPKDRYQSVAELTADLDRFTAGQKPVAPPLTRWRRAKRWVRANRRSVAVCVLLVASVFALGVVWRVQPDSPEVAKRKRLEAIHATLGKGQPAVLVPETGAPGWYETPTGEVAFGENPTGMGGCYFPAYDLTILLLLHPRLDRYTVELELQHVKGPIGPERNTDPVLGFFFGYSRLERPDGWIEQSFLSVGFNDLDRGERGVLVPSAVVTESLCFANARGQLPTRERFPLGKAKPLDSPKRFPGPWRKIIAEISPERVVLKWQPTPDTIEELADWSGKDIRSYGTQHDRALGSVGDLLGRQFAPLPDWSPRQGIGIWGMGAEVAVKNVIVIPH
ncbi:MAG: serine/threonine protein kinase, partial [Planctomycetia bacterium]|nr:serine/threonine protein kinase [Planctomycetia bacterium]